MISSPSEQRQRQSARRRQRERGVEQVWERFRFSFVLCSILPDGSGGFKDVEVLQDVGDRHQPHGTKEPEADPCPVQVYGDKGGRDGEVVHKRVELQHEPDLV